MTDASAVAAAPDAAPRARFRPPAVPRVEVRGFWGARIDAVCARTADTLYQRCEEAGMLQQIDPDQPSPGVRIPFHGGLVTAQMFWDSDFGKVIETAAYCLQRAPNQELERKVDHVIDLYGRLQQPDGYLNSWYQRIEPGLRWTNLRDCHELYCAGHLIEGAVAYFQATGKRKLLDIMCRYMDHVAAVLGTGPGQKRGYCGHEEIELALVKLARVTGQQKYMELAKYFIDERGRQPHFYDAEAREHGRDPKDYVFKTYEYNQSHLPVREQDKVVGHAVRAMYLYSGMADIAMEYGDDSLRLALERLWRDLTSKRLYVTGGLGPSADNEGFTADYDLPNESAYAETCAAVGLVFWAGRMLGLGPDARYADMMELALYNGASSGLSLDGATFFYENPLESRGGHHRWTWHRCPCCPPNIARLTASIGSYMYGQSEDGIAVHLYGDSTATLDVASGKVRLVQATRYPWDGAIALTVEPEAQAVFTLHLRIPGWCRKASLSVNGVAQDLDAITRNGYAAITRRWAVGDTVRLDLELTIERIHAHPEIRHDAGRAAIRRGPLVYCLEGIDNPVPLNSVVLPPDAKLTAREEPGLLGGVVTLEGEGRAQSAVDWGEELYRTTPPVERPVRIKAVPYYAWDNRDPGEMLVWVRTA
ncbi:glycoside hydrolase family 127 protein [Inquilinus limosus]|uniref:glycoside hydrolase family 127 protein n=1 Tax=Inquilinus limosus TaxID=171674 RepID=UPI003F15D4F9